MLLNLPNKPKQKPTHRSAWVFVWEETMPNDIVYILKEDIQPDELRYSLRSVEANFPHGLVWFIGGQPEGITPDRMIRHKQTGNKWERIRSSMLRICEEAELSDAFFLFNDDFYIMKPQRGKFVNFADKTLSWRVEDLKKVHPWLNPYGRTVHKAKEELKMQGFGEVNFEVHMPMLFEKSKIGAIMRCSSPQMRSIYGNVTGCEWIQHDDVKVYDLETVPTDADYLSTNDDTFRNGAVGRYIRESFPKPSRFEAPPYV